MLGGGERGAERAPQRTPHARPGGGVKALAAREAVAGVLVAAAPAAPLGGGRSHPPSLSVPLPLARARAGQPPRWVASRTGSLSTTSRRPTFRWHWRSTRLSRWPSPAPRGRGATTRGRPGSSQAASAQQRAACEVRICWTRVPVFKPARCAAEHAEAPRARSRHTNVLALMCALVRSRALAHACVRARAHGHARSGATAAGPAASETAGAAKAGGAAKKAADKAFNAAMRKATGMMAGLQRCVRPHALMRQRVRARAYASVQHVRWP